MGKTLKVWYDKENTVNLCAQMHKESLKRYCKNTILLCIIRIWAHE
ncbi:hypothetical protein HMPREF2738_03020 [Clostridiales bacterium KLE1615]|nr:hypothetical protein HMPREF2738_03020 [Clostridiales bacterium KLE1615]